MRLNDCGLHYVGVYPTCLVPVPHYADSLSKSGGAMSYTATSSLRAPSSQTKPKTTRTSRERHAPGMLPEPCCIRQHVVHVVSLNDTAVIARFACPDPQAPRDSLVDAHAGKATHISGQGFSCVAQAAERRQEVAKIIEGFTSSLMFPPIVSQRSVSCT